MNTKIKQYYNDLASNYDKNRFGNTYGRYIDLQERNLLANLLKKDHHKKILDLGCGTGRFLNFANYGVDISEKMVAISKTKYNNKNITEGSITNIPYLDSFFDIIFSFHVIMHVDNKTTSDFLSEAHRVLNKKGKLIFDFPSKKRRNITNYKSENWHGSNHFSLKEIKEITKSDWSLKSYQGILFFPIHRFPLKMRRLLIKIDNIFCRSFLKEYASYIIIELEKK